MAEISQKKKANKAPGKSHGFVSAGIAAVMVALLVAVLVMVRVNGYVSLFGKSMFRVVTGSMEPTIMTGALLLADDCRVDELHRGDIVCFRSQEGDTRGWIITHRVVSVLQDGSGHTALETKGDANGAVDSQYVTQDNLIGKVIWYTGEGNLLSSGIGFLTSGLGFLTLIILPCLFISGMLLSRSVRQIRQDIARLQAEAEQEPMEPEEIEALRRQIKEELLAQRESILAEVKDQMVQQGEHYEPKSEQFNMDPGQVEDTEPVSGAQD